MGHHKVALLVLFAQLGRCPDGSLLLVEHMDVAGAIHVMQASDTGYILKFIGIGGIEKEGYAAEFLTEGGPPRMAGWTV